VECDDGEGHTYYYNTATEECVWDKPADYDAHHGNASDVDDELMSALRAKMQKAFAGKPKKHDAAHEESLSAAKAEHAKREAEREAAVAAGAEHWVEVYDPASEAFYYYWIWINVQLFSISIYSQSSQKSRYKHITDLLCVSDPEQIKHTADPTHSRSNTVQIQHRADRSQIQSGSCTEQRKMANLAFSVAYPTEQLQHRADPTQSRSYTDQIQSIFYTVRIQSIFYTDSEQILYRADATQSRSRADPEQIQHRADPT
jgi:hypothetical protein